MITLSSLAFEALETKRNGQISDFTRQITVIANNKAKNNELNIKKWRV